MQRGGVLRGRQRRDHGRQAHGARARQLGRRPGVPDHPELRLRRRRPERERDDRVPDRPDGRIARTPPPTRRRWRARAPSSTRATTRSSTSPWTPPSAARRGSSPTWPTRRAHVGPAARRASGGRLGRPRRRRGGGARPAQRPGDAGPFGNYDAVKADTLRSIMDMAPLPAASRPAPTAPSSSRPRAVGSSRTSTCCSVRPARSRTRPTTSSRSWRCGSTSRSTSSAAARWGVANDVSISVNGSGAAVAACFANPVAPTTTGPGNPMANKADLPGDRRAAHKAGGRERMIDD